MAARNRDERPDDDDSIDDSIEDEFDEELDEDADDESFADEDVDEAPATARRKTAGAGARAGVATRSKTTKDSRPGLFGRLVNFIREIFAELQKVIWPTRKELLTYTTVVIVFVAIMMSFVAGLDVGFARLMFLVFGSGDTN